MDRRAFLGWLGVAPSAVAITRNSGAAQLPIVADERFPLMVYDDKPGTQGPVITDVEQARRHITVDGTRITIGNLGRYSGIEGLAFHRALQEWRDDAELGGDGRLIDIVDNPTMRITDRIIRISANYDLAPGTLEKIRLAAIEHDTREHNCVVVLGNVPHDCGVSWEIEGGVSGWSPWEGLAPVPHSASLLAHGMAHMQQDFLIPHVTNSIARFSAGNSEPFQVKIDCLGVYHVALNAMVPA